MFNRSADIGENKITDKTVNGVPIVLGKKRGRPPKLIKRAPGFYPLDQRISAAANFAVTGDLSKTSEITKIPIGALRKFMQEIWWDEVTKQIHNEENVAISAKLTQTANTVLDALQDRIENGDIYRDRKTGEEYRLPMKGRELMKPIGQLINSRQLLRGEATSRSEKIDTESRLENIAKKFQKFASMSQRGGAAPTEIDVTPDMIEIESNV